MTMINSVPRLMLPAALLAATGLLVTCVGAKADQMVDVTLKDKGMESMTIEFTPAEVKAGEVTFKVTNTSETLVHEFVVARSDTPIEALPYDEGEKEVSEDAMEVQSEIEDIDPGKSGTMTLTLEPGSYILLCNKTGHFKAGMVQTIKVIQ